MINKIAITAILLGLLLAGSLIADEPKEIFGLVLTLVDEDNNPIPDQEVICERVIQGELYIDSKSTDEDGVVGFGASAEEAYYYLQTSWNNWTYTNTIWKPWGQIGVTWQLVIPEVPE